MALSVSELIQKLQALPPELPVMVPTLHDDEQMAFKPMVVAEVRLMHQKIATGFFNDCDWITYRNTNCQCWELNSGLVRPVQEVVVLEG